MKRPLTILSTLLALAAGNAGAEEPRPYTEGAISVVTSVKIMDGQFESYMSFLSKSYKPLMEEQKKAGIILGYAVYLASARTPHDADLYIVVTYPNMASLDGLDDKTDPLLKKVLGQNRSQTEEAAAGRVKIREILGSEIIRELKF